MELIFVVAVKNIFTTITKQVIQLILIMLVDTDVCVTDGLRVGGNRNTRRKPTCLTW